ncbi:MAG: hypothetical protein ACLRFR_00905, partial [Clostridia bacterium]
GGGGALYSHLNDASHASTPHSQGGPQVAQNSANNAQNEALSPQEQLLNGTWECNPENDPIIATTEYGLDIRWHMNGEAELDYIDKIPTGQKLADYAYFTYANVNWVIIGIGKNNNQLSSFWAYFLFQGDNTPASNAIENDVVKEYIMTIASFSDLFPNAVPSNELKSNEVLCFAQDVLYDNGTAQSVVFRENDDGNDYEGSTLENFLTSYYKDKLKDLPISSKVLNTKCSTATSGKDIGPYHLFPLASTNTESFYYGTYLNSGSNSNLDVNNPYWLRTGNVSKSGYTHYINVDGNSGNGGQGLRVPDILAVRPALVLQL